MPVAEMDGAHEASASVSSSLPYRNPASDLPLSGTACQFEGSNFGSHPERHAPRAGGLRETQAEVPFSLKIGSRQGMR